MFAGTFVPQGWLLCDGSLLAIDGEHETLCGLIGEKYGTGPRSVALPDFRGRVPRHDPFEIGHRSGSESVGLVVDNLPTHSHGVAANNDLATYAEPGPVRVLATGNGPSDTLYADDDPTVTMAATSITATGNGDAHENRQPYLCLNFIICADGSYPSPDTGPPAQSVPMVGEVRAFGFDFAPRGWHTCDGQLLPQAQNTALFTVLSNTYGGDGHRHFALPYLNGRVPLGSGQGPGLSDYPLGEAGGIPTLHLTEAELPSHTHSLKALNNHGDKQGPERNVLARLSNAYQTNTTENLTSQPHSLRETGGWTAHNNMMPYLTLLFCIALEGILPQRPHH